MTARLLVQELTCRKAPDQGILLVTGKTPAMSVQKPQAAPE